MMESPFINTREQRLQPIYDELMTVAGITEAHRNITTVDFYLAANLILDVADRTRIDIRGRLMIGNGKSPLLGMSGYGDLVAAFDEVDSGQEHYTWWQRVKRSYGVFKLLKETTKT